MDNKELVNNIESKFGADILSVDLSGDMPVFSVNDGIIRELIAFLKDDERTGFEVLTTLCGVHYPNNKFKFCVVYHLHNLVTNHRIRIKSFISGDDPVTDTISDIFSAANWMERETYDFYGIIFEGHPNLIRILNVEYLDYFPLRKEYPLEDQTREDKDDRFFGR